MNVPRAERPSVICVDCGTVIEVYTTMVHITTEVLAIPDEYVCDECMVKRGSPRYLTEDNVTYVREWDESIFSCIACDTVLWALSFLLKEDRELREPSDGTQKLYLAGSKVEFTECPNPHCDFAWGSAGYQDNINDRYPWLVPPWAQIDVPRAIGIEAYLGLQRQHNRLWWNRRNQKH